jgi:hypothetical protein
MNPSSLPTFDPVAMAKKAAADIEQSLSTKNDTEGMLNALQSHYDSLHQNQKLYIEYLSELVEKLKEVQRGDKESFANLKKEVIKHVLDSEKKQRGPQGV